MSIVGLLGRARKPRHQRIERFEAAAPKRRATIAPLNAKRRRLP